MPPPGAAGQLTGQLLRFARTLRAAGLPIGPGRVLDALVAAAEVGLARREDLYWALHAVLVSRAEHRALFDEAFRLFFRAPEDLPAGLELLLPRSQMPAPERQELSRRLAEALGAPTEAAPEPVRKELDAVLSWSGAEVLRTRDFEQMSARELREAEEVIDRLRLPVRDLPTRRLRPDPRGGRVDLRATLRASLRAGSDAIPLRWRSPAPRPPALVALCDISGSMTRYARVLLRFLHALASRRERVHVLTFGTRLTNVTRYLRHRDADEALAAVGRAVRDWEGGTRIGECLREFNLRWSRRLLSQGAVILLLSDGLDRGEGRGLAAETERLRLSCRRLVWLNPLLRYQGFEPLAAGIRAILPHVDDFRPVHDLESLGALAEALGRPPGRRRAAAAT
jgi:uncharacterized protein with von Willebrand factor type A (vWA) domain